MGLPCRFISATAGMVTFVGGKPCPERSAPAEKLVTLIATPVPLRELRMWPEQVEYTLATNAFRGKSSSRRTGGQRTRPESRTRRQRTGYGQSGILEVWGPRLSGTVIYLERSKAARKTASGSMKRRMATRSL